MFKIAVVCVSDRSSKGERKDLSGPLITEELKDIAKTTEYVCVPDEQSVIEKELIRLCQTDISAVLTTGGTGFAPRDVTPEATVAVAEKNAPGIAEAMRAKSLAFTDKAMLSRAASVIRNNVLIINLPGSPKAVKECLSVIKDVLPHAFELLKGKVADCGRPFEV